MKRVILTYGLISGGIIAVASLGIYSLSDENHHSSEWLGYLVMILALSLVFFGVKSYRDKYQGGVIKFITALGVGLGISLISSIMYVGSWEIYFQNSDGTFMEQYSAYTIKKLEEQGASDQEISETKAQMAEWTEIYKNPVMRIGMTFAEILPVAIIISLISAGILKKSEILPANQ